MNRLTYKELRQLIKKHGYVEVYDSKDDRIRAHIYINSKGRLELKLLKPGGKEYV